MKFELEKWSMKYSDDLMIAMESPELVERLRENYPYPFLSSHARDFIEQRTLKSEEKQYCRVIVVDGHAVGGIEVIIGSGLYAKSGELFVWLTEDFCHRGIGTAAVKQICDEVFEKYDIVRIEARPYIGEDVWIAEKLLWNAGFKYEGTLIDVIYKNDKLYSYKIHSIINQKRLQNYTEFFQYK